LDTKYIPQLVNNGKKQELILFVIDVKRSLRDLMTFNSECKVCGDPIVDVYFHCKECHVNDCEHVKKIQKKWGLID